MQCPQGVTISGMFMESRGDAWARGDEQEGE